MIIQGEDNIIIKTSNSDEKYNISTSQEPGVKISSLTQSDSNLVALKNEFEKHKTETDGLVDGKDLLAHYILAKQ